MEKEQQLTFMSAKEMVGRKMIAVQAMNVNAGDFIFYAGQKKGPVMHFAAKVELVYYDDLLLKVRIRLDDQKLVTVIPSSHVILIRGNHGKAEKV